MKQLPLTIIATCAVLSTLYYDDVTRKMKKKIQKNAIINENEAVPKITKSATTVKFQSCSRMEKRTIFSTM